MVLRAPELSQQDILQHPAVREHLHEIASGKRVLWDPVDYAAVDTPALVLDPTDQQVATNSAKYGVKWQWNACTPNPMILDAAVGSANKCQSFVERPGMQGGDIEFLGFVAKSTDRFSVVPKSNTLNLELSNRPICSTLIFGRGLVGAPWPASFYEPGSGFMLFTATNRVNVLNFAEIVGVGRRFIGEEAQHTIDARRAKFLTARVNPFFAGFDAPQDGTVEFTLPAGGTLDLEITLPSVGDFLSTGLRDDSTRVGGGLPNFKMTIKDGITGYELMNEPISIDLIAAMSLASVDARLPAPSFDGAQGGLFTHLFARSSKILCHYESHDAAVITIRQCFPGVILRYKPAPNRNTNTSEQNRAELLSRAVRVPYGNVVEGGRS